MKTKKIRPTLRQLEREAFPNHRVSLKELREKYHYVLQGAVKSVDKKLLMHIRRCKHCQQEITRLSEIEPLWADDRLQKVLIEIVKRP